MKLDFQGPLCFHGDEASVFAADLENAPSVYLWTIRQKDSGAYLIHYVGETNQLGLRHREHLMNILGLYYGIFDVEKARMGICEMIWPGLWRRRIPEGPREAIEFYRKSKDEVLRYLSSISVFYAEVDADRTERKLIEGVIGWKLREEHPEHSELYPQDNYVERPADSIHGELDITASEVILGLDSRMRF